MVLEPLLKATLPFNELFITTGQISLNPFIANAPLLYVLKMSEDFWTSDVFRG